MSALAPEQLERLERCACGHNIQSHSWSGCLRDDLNDWLAREHLAPKGTP
jgi:hypothetical protein